MTINDATKDAIKDAISKIQNATQPVTLNFIFKNIGNEYAEIGDKSVNQVVIDLAGAIQHAKQPVTMSCDWCNIGNQDAQTFADAIKNGTQPVSLNFKHNSIADDGAKAFADAIENATHPKPVSLNLFSNFIGIEGVIALAAAIRNAKNPVTLNLANTYDGRFFRIGNDVAMAFADGIENTKHPVSLDLTYNSIGYEGAKALALAISNATQPVTLDLKGNKMIGTEGVKAFALAIGNATQPVTLGLAGHGIGYEDAKFLALADAIQKAKHPLSLDLSENGIGISYGCVNAFANAIKNATQPVTLDLAGNRRIDLLDAEVLTKAVAQATVLVKVRIPADNGAASELSNEARLTEYLTGQKKALSTLSTLSTGTIRIFPDVIVGMVSEYAAGEMPSGSTERNDQCKVKIEETRKGIIKDKGTKPVSFELNDNVMGDEGAEAFENAMQPVTLGLKSEKALAEVGQARSTVKVETSNFPSEAEPYNREDQIKKINSDFQTLMPKNFKGVVLFPFKLILNLLLVFAWPFRVMYARLGPEPELSTKRSQEHTSASAIEKKWRSQEEALATSVKQEPLGTVSNFRTYDRCDLISRENYH